MYDTTIFEKNKFFNLYICGCVKVNFLPLKINSQNIFLHFPNYFPSVLRIRVWSDPIFLGYPYPDADLCNTGSVSFMHKKKPVIQIFSL